MPSSSRLARAVESVFQRRRRDVSVIRTNLVSLLAVAPLLIVVLGFQILPALQLLVNSVYREGDFTLSTFVDILSNPYYLQSMRNSFMLSLTSSLAGIAIGGLAAYILSTSPHGLRDRLLLVTSVTSNFAGVPLAFAYMILVGSNGMLTVFLAKVFHFKLYDHFSLYSWVGLAVAYTYFQIPLATLLTYPAFFGIKREWTEASASLGGTPWQFWRTVGIPVVLPSLVGTFVILFANALGAYATAYALTAGVYNLMTLRLAYQITSEVMYDPNMTAALAVILVSVTVACLAVYQMSSGRLRRWLA